MTGTSRPRKPARDRAAHFLSLPDLADRWGVSTRTVRRLIDSGELPVTRISRSVRIRLQDVEQYESEHDSDAAR